MIQGPKRNEPPPFQIEGERVLPIFRTYLKKEKATLELYYSFKSGAKVFTLNLELVRLLNTRGGSGEDPWKKPTQKELVYVV